LAAKPRSATQQREAAIDRIAAWTKDYAPLPGTPDEFIGRDGVARPHGDAAIRRKIFDRFGSFRYESPLRRYALGVVSVHSKGQGGKQCIGCGRIHENGFVNQARVGHVQGGAQPAFEFRIERVRLPQGLDIAHELTADHITVALKGRIIGGPCFRRAQLLLWIQCEERIDLCRINTAHEGTIVVYSAKHIGREVRASPRDVRNEHGYDAGGHRSAHYRE